MNAILDHLPVGCPSSSASDDEEQAAGSKMSSRGCGGCSVPGASVFKKARRGTTKTTLRLKAGLDKEVPSSQDKPVYDSNEKEIDDKEIDNDVNDNVNDKEINDDVNEDDDA